jgi:hypothetical protein
MIPAPGSVPLKGMLLTWYDSPSESARGVQGREAVSFDSGIIQSVTVDLIVARLRGIETGCVKNIGSMAVSDSEGRIHGRFARFPCQRWLCRRLEIVARGQLGVQQKGPIIYFSGMNPNFY